MRRPNGGSRPDAARRSRSSISYAPNAPSPFQQFAKSADPDAPLERLRRGSSIVEDHIETLSQPVKPFVPAIGRFLIVVTFLEDALRCAATAARTRADRRRILTQWTDQLYYIQRHRHFPWGIAHLFLLINVIVRALLDRRLD